MCRALPGRGTPRSRRAGLLVASHPQLATAVLEGQAPLRYLRVTVPPTHTGEDWRAALRDLQLLPLHVTGAAGATVYAIGTTPARCTPATPSAGTATAA